MTGISPGEGEEQLMRVVVDYSDNPALIPDPEFSLSGDQTSGEFIIRPRPAQSGFATVYFYLMDSGPDGDFSTWQDNAYSDTLQELRIKVTPIRATIASPVGVLVEQRPSFSWSDVPGASEYRVWISNSSTGRNPLILTNVTNSWYIPEQDLGIGKFDVWVQAVKPDGKRLPWSLRQSFEIATPVALPQLPVRVTNPRSSVEWPAIPGADAYEVYVSNLAAGPSGVIRQTVTTNSWAPSVDLGLTRWRIWVRALVRGKYTALWSSPRDFTVVTPPVPAGPLVFSTQQQPAFEWSRVEGADRYGLQLRNAVTGRVVIDVRGLTSPTFTPVSPVGLGRYRWWAMAESTVSGVRSDWSVGVDLVISDRPVLLGPSGNVSSRTPTFTWMAFPNAAYYEVWMTRMQPQQFVMSAANITQTEWQVPITLAPGSPYRFWVRAVTNDNRTTAWSQYLEFSVADSTPSRWPAELNALPLLADSRVSLAVPPQLSPGPDALRPVRSQPQPASTAADPVSEGMETAGTVTTESPVSKPFTAQPTSHPIAPSDEELHLAVLDQVIAKGDILLFG